MKKEKAELIELRLNRAEESFEMIKLCVEEKFWNSAATHLYYTCFYLIQALFAEKELEVKTHRGLKLISLSILLTRSRLIRIGESY